jgi:hypothetical protein
LEKSAESWNAHKRSPPSIRSALILSRPLTSNRRQCVTSAWTVLIHPTLSAACISRGVGQCRTLHQHNYLCTDAMRNRQYLVLKSITPNNWSNLCADDHLGFCNLIQTSVMDPFYQTTSHCEPCLDEAETLAECIVNDVSGCRPLPCEFVYEASSTRRRARSNVHLMRAVANPRAYSAAELPESWSTSSTSHFRCVENEFLEVPEDLVVGTRARLQRGRQRAAAVRGACPCM